MRNAVSICKVRTL